jgi:predicted HD superfamily hydrolase involved in NAD metabolism
VLEKQSIKMNKFQDLLLEKYLASKNLDYQKRYDHSLSVARKTKELIDRFNIDVDIDKAAIAATLHDYAKFETMASFKGIVDEFKIDKSILNYNYKVLHALLGPYYLIKELSIYDPEILNAVRYHATGSLEMSPLSEVIFLADFIEDLREEDYFIEARELSKIDFKKAIAAKIKNSINVSENKGFYQKMYKKYQES